MLINCWRPKDVLRSCDDEIYPAVPKPRIDDVIVFCSPSEDVNPAVPRPITVEVSSVGSMNVLINCWRPKEVLRSCCDEM